MLSRNGASRINERRGRPAPGFVILDLLYPVNFYLIELSRAWAGKLEFEA